MSQITCVILTFNESLHIARAIENAKKVATRVIVVDSYSTDSTINISKELRVDVFQNKFISQAQQFEWAMQNCNIQSEWILRLDADETFDAVLADNIKNFILNQTTYNGAIFHRKHYFLNKWVKRGGRYPLPMLRLFRKGTAHIEQKWMDEHIVLDTGESKLLKGEFVDDNLNNVSWFVDKHNKYATREVIDIYIKKLLPKHNVSITEGTGVSIRAKRFLKNNIYMKLPLFLRPFLYFIFRYFIQLGFLDGYRGFAYHFLQGFWYRVLVDIKYLEIAIEIEKVKAETVSDKLAVIESFTNYDLSEYKK